MSEIVNDTNSGVEALTGFSFQRNSAIFIVLDNYDFFVTHDFFICIEHHDDLIFSYLNDSNEICKIDAYQAKKSVSEWGTGSSLVEIIAKMTLVGRDLERDVVDKSENYSHDLTFLTNKSVKLNCGSKKNGEKHSEIIRENNLVACYSNLHSRIQDNILNKLKNYTFEADQLEKINFRYIDIGNTDKAQRNQLIGMLSDIFKDKVSDPSAALDLILKLFREVETVFNQGNTSKLLDESKRIYGKYVLEAINVICNKSKAFKLWRDNAQELSEALKIPVSKGRNYTQHLNNCFDYFKDLNQVEFQKIYHFVNDNREMDDLSYSDTSCITKLNAKFHQIYQTQLDNVLVSFAIVAAYVETRNIVS